jgi:tetratricopeptide (TPR) repeat protein
MTKKGFGAVLALATLVTFGLTPAMADFEQAMNYFKGGKYVEAAAEFQALVDQSPDYADGYQMLGLSFLQMKKPNEAIEAFQKAIDLNGDRFEFYHGLASAYYAEKAFGKAVGSMRTAEPLAKAEQQKYHLYSLRGLSYVGLEKWDDAIADLEKARAIRDSATISDRLGLAYYQLGHADKAVPILRSALKAQPNSASNWLMLTNGLLDLGAETRDEARKVKYYGEAMEAAKRYQKLKPSSYEADNLVGRAAFGAKEFGTAEQSFEKVLEKKPDYCYAMANLGKLYITTEKWASAEKVLRKGTACDSKMAVMHESLGRWPS